MTYRDYREAGAVSLRNAPFAALIMAAIHRADTKNLARLKIAFPDLCAEFEARYTAPGGYLPDDIRPRTEEPL